jgi:hypothetical protein
VISDAITIRSLSKICGTSDGDVVALDRITASVGEGEALLRGTVIAGPCRDIGAR